MTDLRDQPAGAIPIANAHEIHALIRGMPTAAGLTRAQLATATGYHPSQIRDWENAEKRPNLDSVIAVLRALRHQLAVIPPIPRDAEPEPPVAQCSFCSRELTACLNQPCGDRRDVQDAAASRLRTALTAEQGPPRGSGCTEPSEALLDAAKVDALYLIDVVPSRTLDCLSLQCTGCGWTRHLSPGGSGGRALAHILDVAQEHQRDSHPLQETYPGSGIYE